MARGFDAASVAETTRFLATSAQPLESANELAAVDAPALIVPGTDAEHPANVAYLYAGHLRRAELVDPTSPEVISERIAAFCAALG
jgi:hypothetical protein